MVARSRLYPLALAGILLLGLALRVANAQGALWLDEAWSARLAHDAGTPLGVFLNINHDNNHHLNSVWLQLIGLQAPPVLARAPAILAGTVTIWIAALLGRRSGRGPALAMAALFAVSPMLVTLGSEARGYAPMVLALLAALLLAERWAAGDTDRSPSTSLALLFLVGALFQLTIVFGFAAVAGATFWRRWQATALRPAVVDTARLFAPAAIALFALLALVFGAATANGTGMQFGAVEPFDLLALLDGLIAAISSAFGPVGRSPWWLAGAVALAFVAPLLGVRRVAFTRLAIVAFPVAVALLQLPNAGHPRYYLLVSIALLLLTGEAIGVALAERRRRRWVAGTALLAILALSLADARKSIANQRGDPGAAIRAMTARAPGGATVLLDRDNAEAVIDVAAIEAGYPLKILRDACPARFLFVDRVGGEAFNAREVRCGVPYRPIASAAPHGLSGTYWTLYERAR